MLSSNPLTPPNDDSADTLSPSHGPSSTHHAQDQFATPTSNGNMGTYGGDLEAEEELSPRADDQYESHEDEYMGYHDNVQAHGDNLNAELDAVDYDLMEAQNHQSLWEPAHGYDAAFGNFGGSYEDDYQAEPPSPPANIAPEPGPVGVPGTADPPNLPTSLSAVSLQLQHLQDGQDHIEIAGAGDELHGNFTDNSIPSILFPVYSHMSAEQDLQDLTLEGPQVSYVSMSSVSATNTASQTILQAPEPVVAQGEVHSFVFGLAGMQQTVVVDNTIADLWQDNMSDADDLEVDDHSNFSFRNFLERWGQIAQDPTRREAGPNLGSVESQRQYDVEPMHASDLEGEGCDMQRINWKDLGVSRLSAQQMRRQTYKNYTNLKSMRYRYSSGARIMTNESSFFKFRKMDFNHKVHLSHFQLRNLLACPTRDHIFYACRSKILQWDPTQSNDRHPRPRPTVAMDLTNPAVQPHNGHFWGIQTSTMTVANDVLVAGGFCGEYALINLRGEKEHKHTEGLIIDHANSITNHVQVHLPRNSSLPQAVFASNDTGVRILDINTNKWVAEHTYPYAMNCSAISPDQRLRVLVGDSTDVLICDADSGKTLVELKDQHMDFGFACDWADDGWTVATGNQDKLIKIWDARNWKFPITTIAAEMAGVRKLKFSPLGSGRRVLLAAEPADYISVIDCSTFSCKQTLNFFGEIAGVDFTNDGQDIIVANCDDYRGGLMEFERCGLADSAIYDLLPSRDIRRSRKARHQERYGYDWISDTEELVRHPKSRGTAELHERRAANLATHLDFF